IENLLETFCHIIYIAIDKYIPLKIKKEKILNKWSIRTSKEYAKKRKAGRKDKKCKNNTNLNIYRQASFKAKASAKSDDEFHEYNILNSANYKVFYSFVNSKLISRNRIPPLCKDGVTYVNSKDKANLLQHFFSLNYTYDDNNLPYFPIFTQNVKDSVLINENIILKSLKRLPNKISSGPDNIPAILLKKTATSIYSLSSL
ncbi:MAG: hypothetical protein MJA29_11810, partial [Candidatus Omnitrophica bacterium]|nr:hypothetical protein [Candidatus Omnitrophota bacterium]